MLQPTTGERRNDAMRRALATYRRPTALYSGETTSVPRAWLGRRGSYFSPPWKKVVCMHGLRFRGPLPESATRSNSWSGNHS